MAIDGPDDSSWQYQRQNNDGPLGQPDVTLDPIEVLGQRPPVDTEMPGPYDGPVQGLPDFGGGSPDSGGGFMDFLKSMKIPGWEQFGMNPNMIPLLLSAYNQYNNSGKYMDMATKYKDEMNPFGTERDYYKKKLRDLETDPNAYLTSSPDYQAALRQGLGARERSQAASGYAGSGTGGADIQRFGADLGAGYLDRDRQSLMQMAGANIGPAAAAGLISQGIKGSVDSQNAALADLTRAFTKPEGNKTVINNNNGGPAGGGKVPQDVQKIIDDAIRKSGPSGLTPAGYSSMVSQLMARGFTQQQAQQFIRDGQAGGDLQEGIGNHAGNGPPDGSMGLVDTGDGWYDPSTGRYMDYEGNLIGNVGGPGEPGAAGDFGGDLQGPIGSNEDINYPSVEDYGTGDPWDYGNFDGWDF